MSSSSYSGMLGVVAPVFVNRPTRCPYGHELRPGQMTISWMPCLCQPAREAAEAGRGLGHLRVRCEQCHGEHREAVFYEPPHDVRHWG